MPDESGYWVHVCLYSQSVPPHSESSLSDLFHDLCSGKDVRASDQGTPRSLDEIQRTVDRPLDARFSPLSIQLLDLPQQRQALIGASMTKAGAACKRESGSGIRTLPLSPSPRASQVPPHSPPPSSTATAANANPIARFIKESSFSIEGDAASGSRSSNLEVSFGIVHLFRDDAALRESSAAKTKTTLEDDTGTILAILGVPSHIGPADFLQYIEPAANAISQVRMIREERAHRSMVLLKFREAANAEEFHKMYADQPFDSLDDPNELCRVVYVTKVSISTTSTLPYAYPLLANSDPWPIMTNNVVSSSSQADSGAMTSRLAGSVAVELPTCPVCLERMDASVTGLMTVTCQHTFHCSCLSRWSDSRCPVCRYTQSRIIKKGQYVTPSFVPENGCCAVCGTGSDLWVCLICATVGCGRYKAGHAHRHHQETGHLYSLELETQRVWDYAGDGYVHRLIQNKAESKTADEGGPTPATFRDPPVGKSSRQMEASGSAAGQSRLAKGEGMSEMEEKMEAIGLEYSHLLSTQLESQRAFYEDQVRMHQRRVEEVEGARAEVHGRAEQTERERRELKHSLEVVTNRYDGVHKNLEKSLTRIKSLDEDLKGERLMSMGLVGKIERLDGEIEGSKREMAVLRMENAELQEQVRDLMVFLETRDTIQREGGEEMRGGGVSVGKGKGQGQQAQTTAAQTESPVDPAAKAKKKKKAKGKGKVGAEQGEGDAGE